MEYKLALIGFGGVNRSLAEIIFEQEKFAGMDIKIVDICDIQYGTVSNYSGINLGALLQQLSDSRGFANLQDGAGDGDAVSCIEKTTADIVVEATYSNPKDGEPALTHCRNALERGMSVVTTNKGPIALAGGELESLAKRRGCAIRYEGTVMSGTPVLRFAEENLRGCAIKGCRGILNGTANYVLGRVEHGLSMKQAVREAQSMGCAEANPDADLRGWDVALKVVILANTLFGTSLRFEDVRCAGIDTLDEQKIREATNGHWKLIGQVAQKAGGGVEVAVAPALVPFADPLSRVDGVTNAITFATDLLGDVSLQGPGAGRRETAFAILSDIVSLARRSIDV